MAAIETPCILVCSVHPATQLCVGCGRSLDEIANWVSFTDTERTRVMADLPQRLAALSRSRATPAPPRA